MSSRTNTPIWRTARTLRIMFWAGVACAPLSALVLMLASSEGTIKFALVLGLACVVLIGLSVTWRRDASSVERELVTALADVEADTHRLVAELRAEIRQLGRAGEPRPVSGHDEAAALERGRRSPSPTPRARAVLDHDEYGDGGHHGDFPDRSASYGRTRGRESGGRPDFHRDPDASPRGRSGRPSGRAGDFDEPAPTGPGDDADRYPAGDRVAMPRQRGTRHDDLRERPEVEQRDRRGTERGRYSAGPEDGWQAGGNRRAWPAESSDRRGHRYDEPGVRGAIGPEEAEQQTRWSEYEQAAGHRPGNPVSYMDEFYGDGRRLPSRPTGSDGRRRRVVGHSARSRRAGIVDPPPDLFCRGRTDRPSAPGAGTTGGRGRGRSAVRRPRP